jgi:hypothetical protein
MQPHKPNMPVLRPKPALQQQRQQQQQWQQHILVQETYTMQTCAQIPLHLTAEKGAAQQLRRLQTHLLQQQQRQQQQQLERQHLMLMLHLHQAVLEAS